MGWWGSARSFGRKVWKRVKSTAKRVWHGIGGLTSIISNIVKNGISKISLLWEIPLVYLEWIPEKKLRLRVVILSDENGNPIAPRDRVESAVAITQRIFERELNVKVEGVFGDIVRESAERAPSDVLNPPCSSGASDIHTQIGPMFGEMGAWYRNRIARTPGGTFAGYGTPVTMFVVRDVQGSIIGCAHLAWFENYGYIEPTALPPSWAPTGDVDEVKPYEDFEHATLAHEIGHSCDLFHRKPKRNLMYSNQSRTGTSLTKWQKAVARSCTHITYR
ncbi:hypothetical protein [Kocuria nitroreducens]|uniref:hypothetical protein n=1 Tax=Kocuria nitroreducens TaxID=3058914 RepID=UPI0036DDE5C9